jgi:hypothetical protein
MIGTVQLPYRGNLVSAQVRTAHHEGLHNASDRLPRLNGRRSPTSTSTALAGFRPKANPASKRPLGRPWPVSFAS